MKKVLNILLIFTFVFLLAGCGKNNKVSCSIPSEKEDDDFRGKIIAEFNKDDKVEEITLIVEFKSEELAKEYIKKLAPGYKELAKVVGKNIEMHNAEKNPQYEELVGKTKEEFTKFAKKLSNNVTCD